MEQMPTVLVTYLNTLKSAKSREDHKTLIENLCKFTGKEVFDVNKDDAKGYTEMLLRRRREGKLAQSTINVRIARLRAIYNYTLKKAPECGIKENPFIGIEVPQVKEYISPLKIPDRKQLEHITEIAFADQQLYTAVVMIKRCAFTVGELCSIRTDAIVMDKEENCGVRFVYRTKERWVKIPEDVVELMDALVKERGYVSEYLFCNRKGNQLRVRDMERLYRRYVPAEIPFTLQDIRNAAVTCMLQCGAPDRMVAEYIDIAYSWITRYSVAVKELDLAPVDFVTEEMYQKRSREQELNDEVKRLQKELQKQNREC